MSWLDDTSRTPRSQIDWDAVKQQSRELNSGHDRVVSNVPKYTAVKEGQQHPVGKNGQLRLFHEHVWPKGYTPQRMQEVADVTAGMVNDDVGTNHSAHLQNKIVETMARSTVPVDTLRDMAHLSSIEISDGTGAGGSFNPDESLVTIDIDNLGKKNSFKSDPSGTVASQATMHELGHLHDYMSDSEDFYRKMDKNEWYTGSGGHMASPALEGRAEGFRLATTRITRGMRRTNEALMSPTSKYSVSGFRGPQARSAFEVNRLKSFRHASGQTSLPYITETPATAETLEQPTLPGMEKYL